MSQTSNKTKILSSMLVIMFVIGMYIVTNRYEAEVDSKITSDRRYMVGLDIQTSVKYGNTTFLVYDGDVLVESDNVSRTVFREDTQDYQYVCYCTEKNWAYVEASTFRFVWYDADNDKDIIDITATPILWSDSYGYGNYFIWLDRYEHSSIILARVC